MTVAMAVVLTSHADSLAEALTVVVLAGFLQVLLGVSRIGRFVAYTPHVVVSGFMSGIGVIIVLMQALPLFGAPGAKGGTDGRRAGASRGSERHRRRCLLHRSGDVPADRMVGTLDEARRVAREALGVNAKARRG